MNKIKSKTILVLLAILILSGCAQGKVDPYDRQTGVSREEIKKSFFASAEERRKKREEREKSSSTNYYFKNNGIGSIPKPSQMVAIPAPKKFEKKELISFSVTEEVPLKDVLIELAKAANLDLDLDPSISGGIIINARNRPLTEVLDRVSELGNLRYSLRDNRLHVQRDDPYSKNYSVDYLIDGNIWEEVQSNINSLISENSGSITSNKLANMMTIFATSKDHKKIVEYLREVKKHSSAQVLIEAKVIEVTLNDKYETGIDWSWLGSGETQISQSGGANTASDPIQLVLNGKSLFGGSLTSTITALEEFGTVKAIASPRINALNNQTATLNFTKKLVFFTTDISTDSTTTSGVSNETSTITSTLNEETAGTELSITPAIDLLNDEITLNVEPKITIKTEDVEQPVFDPNDASVILTTNLIPVINTRELKTVARVKSGNILVIGGVMTEETSNVDSGVPFLSRIPLLGNLFKSVSKNAAVTETVIFIKAQIIRPDEKLNDYDINLHDNFTSSSRPFLEH